MLTDPTLEAAMSVWAETVHLRRSPEVALEAIFTAPDSLRTFGGVSIDTVDAAVTVRTADIADLSIQPQERIRVRGENFHVLALLEDDGAGTAILLRRLVA